MYILYEGRRPAILDIVKNYQNSDSKRYTTVWAELIRGFNECLSKYSTYSGKEVSLLDELEDAMYYS